jgi:hypothetical protein
MIDPMTNPHLTLQLTKDELGPVRATMRDIQLAVASYYGLTARSGDVDELGTPVRAFLTGVQQLNESLLIRVADSATYETLKGQKGAPAVIDAAKYARNVVEHVLHVVRPDEDTSLIGGIHGSRTYAQWAHIPYDVDAKLHKGTRALRPSYVATVEGREIVEVMLDVLHAFWSTAPDVVHRDQLGEWTGFPLHSQPGVGSRLHPEEPSDRAAAEEWLNSRRPNGTMRLVCGQLTFEGDRLVYGFTFIGQYTFSPFVESPAQVARDVANGARYVRGDSNGQLEDRTQEFRHGVQGAVLFAPSDLRDWTEELREIELGDDWCVFLVGESWVRVARTERGACPQEVRYQIRRARRLNAFVASRD